MCILEAVTGDVPWGSASDDDIRHVVLVDRQLPERPDNISDRAWRLIERLCAFDPADRLPLVQAVEELQLLEEQEGASSSLNGGFSGNGQRWSNAPRYSSQNSSESYVHMLVTNPDRASNSSDSAYRCRDDQRENDSSLRGLHPSFAMDEGEEAAIMRVRRRGSTRSARFSNSSRSSSGNVDDADDRGDSNFRHSMVSLRDIGPEWAPPQKNAETAHEDKMQRISDRFRELETSDKRKAVVSRSMSNCNPRSRLDDIARHISEAGPDRGMRRRSSAPSGDSEAMECEMRGHRALTKGRPEEAVAHFTRALELNPKNTVVLAERARAHLALSQWDCAMMDASMLIRFKPNSSDGYALKAEAQQCLRRR
ncbi:TPA: hypothetical protein N0F65_007521 [Lagenidium giganteum]|uniref:Uncharacterized protein n=1 Tax=Lagenidium giganteum TaxID=4803 RepID=A0AAV2ZN78_9STRA|nr:TPA: hypothetical protein N0F65_007521 [Lagenidium giganteum]